MPGCWTVDPKRWTLGAGLSALDSGLSTLDTGHYMSIFHSNNTHWTLGSGHLTLSLAVLEQNQKPTSDSA